MESELNYNTIEKIFKMSLKYFRYDFVRTWNVFITYPEATLNNEKNSYAITFEGLSLRYDDFRFMCSKIMLNKILFIFLREFHYSLISKVAKKLKIPFIFVLFTAPKGYPLFAKLKKCLKNKKKVQDRRFALKISQLYPHVYYKKK